MAQLPTEPQRGERPKAETIAKLIRHAKASQIVNSVDIVAMPGPGGTSLLLRDRSRSNSKEEARFPFQVYQAPPEDGGDNSDLWRTFQVHEGKVACKSPSDSDSADEPLRITAPANSDKYYVWLQISIRSGGLKEPVVESVTIKHGDDPKTEGWEKFPSQDGVSDWNQTEAWNVFIVLATITTGQDETQELTIRQNVRSDLTVQLPVDHVLPLKTGGIRVYKKIIIFGPDNYVECPELQSMTSSGSSSGSSSAPGSSSQQESSGSSGMSGSGESGGGSASLISSDVSSGGLASVEYHWLYRFYRPNGAAWNTVAMEEGWLYTPYSDDPAHVTLESSVVISNGTTLGNPYCFALKVDCTDLQSAYPTFLATIVHGPRASLDLQPEINFEEHKPKYGTLYLVLAEVTANNGLLEVWEKCRDAVSYHEAIRAGFYEIGLVVGRVYEPADDTSSSQPSSEPSSEPSSAPSSEPESGNSSAASSTPVSSVPQSEPPSWSPPPQSKTAIVPYTPPGSRKTQYVALSCVESPDVRFEDIVKIHLRGRSKARRKIDRILSAVCEPESVEVVSSVPSSPAIVGARVSGREIIVEVARVPGLRVPVFVTLRVSGIRLGFAGKRFVRHTLEEMRNNSQFWRSATLPRR